MSTEILTATIKVREVKKGKQYLIEYESKNGTTQTASLNGRLLSKPLALVFEKTPEELVDLDVEFILDGGKVQKVTEAGKPWEPSTMTDNRRGKKPRSNNPSKQRPGQRFSTAGQSRQALERFENPYNFIPALQRVTNHRELGDAPPVGHQRWFHGYWSGRIVVTITTCTPLLIPELLDDKNDHKRFGVRIDQNGAPYLPPTSVKGSLRAAYEAITNSRMGVFPNHKNPLAYRNETKTAASVVPAIINEAGNLVLQPGHSKISSDGSPENQQLYAAWLPLSLIKKQRFTVEHGTQVWAKLEYWQHQISPKGSDQWKTNFTFLRAIALAPNASDVPVINTPKSVVGAQKPANESRFQRYSNLVPGKEESSFWVRGRVCITGKNMRNKHDERIFFVDDSHTQCDHLEIPVDEKVRHRWRTLLTNYQEEHRKDIESGNQGPAGMPGVVYSRHITGGESEAQLVSDSMCYASIEQNARGGFDINALYPVQISRNLYDGSPAELLDDTLVSARNLNEFSPADRVFGYVCADDNQSYKGQLRIGTASCSAGARAIKSVGDSEQGQPLAILGQPKPAQARFYAAANPQAEPLADGVDKSTAYSTDEGLRGRKVYPHQRHAAEVDSYWETNHSVSEAMNFKGRKVYREWLSHDGTQSSQNRSIIGWVIPGTSFEVPIDVINLSAVELGALLWMLQLGDNNYLRMGGAKPLGFGSVQVAIDKLELRDGEAIQADYLAFSKSGTTGGRISSTDQADTLIDAYRSALPQAVNEVGTTFEQLRIIRAFLGAASGGNLPIHYPRTDKQQYPQGENFKWFVKNQQAGHALPPLWGEDRGLPVLKEK